ncbi:hypothetical protein K438DRAFT_268158 [Mycena galopus ATCC 62051]|nr:hypothetical protein K438DRAFT_268158 [Mycena galopus ATCC 62051]
MQGADTSVSPAVSRATSARTAPTPTRSALMRCTLRPRSASAVASWGISPRIASSRRSASTAGRWCVPSESVIFRCANFLSLFSRPSTRAFNRAFRRSAFVATLVPHRSPIPSVPPAPPHITPPALRPPRPTSAKIAPRGRRPRSRPLSMRPRRPPLLSPHIRHELAHRFSGKTFASRTTLCPLNPVHPQRLLPLTLDPSRGISSFWASHARSIIVMISSRTQRRKFSSLGFRASTSDLGLLCLCFCIDFLANIHPHIKLLPLGEHFSLKVGLQTRTRDLCVRRTGTSGIMSSSWTIFREASLASRFLRKSRIFGFSPSFAVWLIHTHTLLVRS